MASVRLLVAGLLAVTVAGCGGLEVDEGEPGGELSITQRSVGGGVYVEGAKSYIELEGNDDTLKQELERNVTRLRLKPGDYEFHSSQRVCEGNCDSLDEPDDGCTKAIEVSDGQAQFITVMLSPGHGCRVVVTGASQGFPDEPGLTAADRQSYWHSVARGLSRDFEGVQGPPGFEACLRKELHARLTAKRMTQLLELKQVAGGLAVTHLLQRLAVPAAQDCGGKRWAPQLVGASKAFY